MGQPAAKHGDRITGTDLHIVSFPNGATQTLPFAFNGVIDTNVSTNVNIGGQPAATVGSIARNSPAHFPAPGQAFVNRPSNEGKITNGSKTVRINGKPAARSGDRAETCHDRDGAPPAVVAGGSVLIG